jgi:hypothetical protein
MAIKPFRSRDMVKCYRNRFYDCILYASFGYTRYY